MFSLDYFSIGGEEVCVPLVKEWGSSPIYTKVSEQPLNDGEPASAKCPIQAGSADSKRECPSYYDIRKRGDSHLLLNEWGKARSGKVSNSMVASCTFPFFI